MIHIGYDEPNRERKFRLDMCQYSPADYHPQTQQYLRDTKLYPALDLREQCLLFDEDGDTHSDCFHSSLRPHLALHLLQICRQVYSEAALVPFAKNFFVVAVSYSRSPLRAFLATLVPVQVRAIAQLFMDSGVSYDQWSPQSFGVLELKGLRSLRLVLRSCFCGRHSGSPTIALRWNPRCHELGSLSHLDL
jgi:hypothetical protein